MNKAFHKSATIIIFDESLPFFLWHSMFLCESLLLEVANGKIICISEKILNILWLHVMLESIHETSTVSSNLFICSNRQECHFCESLRFVLSVADTTNDFGIILQYYHWFMVSIEHQFDNVFFGHLRQLSGEYILQIDEQFHVPMRSKRIFRKINPKERLYTI